MSCKGTLQMEDSRLKQTTYKFPFRPRVRDFRLPSCFMPSRRRDKRFLLQSHSSAPRSPSSGAPCNVGDEFFSDEDEPDVGELLITDSPSSESVLGTTTLTTSAESGEVKSQTGHGVRTLALLVSDDESTSPMLMTVDAIIAGLEATEESFVFSPPAFLTDNIAVETTSVRTLSDPLLSTFSYDCSSALATWLNIKSLAWISVSRSSATILDHNFGGRQAQPLRSPPVTPNAHEISGNGAKARWLAHVATQSKSGSCHGSAMSSSSSELRFNSGIASSFVSTSTSHESLSASLAGSEEGEDSIGSWSIRQRCGRKAPGVGGVPLPSPSVATQLLPGLHSFEFEELLDATREFAPECCVEKGAFGAVYRACMRPASLSNEELGPMTELAVVRLAANDNQTLQEWKWDVQMLAQLPVDKNICVIQGYCAHEEDVPMMSEHNGRMRVERLLVFEQSPNGNLRDYLCGSRSKTTLQEHLEWPLRISIVLGAARGLLYLHDRAPVQLLYRDFKAASVLLDKDYTPRLAGYGLTVTSWPDAANTSSFTVVMKKSQAHAKTNVWSFGIVLLELLTGKDSRDACFMCCDGKSFVQWAAPFLKDEAKLLLILDPRLKATKCPVKGALKLAELALRCLKKKKAQRPSMARVVDTLKKLLHDNVISTTEQSSKALIPKTRTFGGISFHDSEHRSKSWASICRWREVILLENDKRPDPNSRVS